MSNDKTKDYGLKDMINDFVNPAEYKKTSDLATMGDLRVTGLTNLYEVGAYTLTGQMTSTVATGTAPFVIASTTAVANLNAS